MLLTFLPKNRFTSPPNTHKPPQFWFFFSEWRKTHNRAYGNWKSYGNWKCPGFMMNSLMTGCKSARTWQTILVRQNSNLKFITNVERWKYFLVINQLDAPISRIYFVMKLYMFWTVRFVDSFRAGAYAPARKLSTNLHDIYHCWVYSPDDGQ